jgi:hypothetical protein
MKLHIGLLCLAMLIAAVSGMAMTWDGSYLFIKTLDDQAPYIPQGRAIVLPSQWAILIASRFTNNFTTLHTVFGIVYGLIPIGSLISSWWIVRDNAASLYVWPVFGIGLAVLPGTFPVFAEAVLAVYFFWPIALAILMGMQIRHFPIAVLFASAVLVTHPTSIPIYFLSAGLSLIAAARIKNARPRLLASFGLFTSYILLAGLRFFLMRSSYEEERLSAAILLHQFDVGVAGLPLLSLLCGCMAAICVYAMPYIKSRNSRTLAAIALLIELVALVLATLALVVWATNGRFWRGAFDFRSWALVCSLPFIALATAEQLWCHKHEPMIRMEQVHRQRTIMVVSMSFLLVLSVQSWSWLNLTTRLREVLVAHANACVPTSSMGWSKNTPLDHWSVTAYSLMLQGRRPQKIVLNDKGCEESKFDDGFPIADWDWRRWDAGWIDMKVLQAQLWADHAAVTDH